MSALSFWRAAWATTRRWRGLDPALELLMRIERLIDEGPFVLFREEQINRRRRAARSRS
jgi:hypothetical protein